MSGSVHCTKKFSKEYYKNLFFFIRKQYSETIVYPKADEIFTAFHLTPLEKVKVVILGQDPYHNEGQAHGLCFSVKPQVAIPPSLENIYKELHDDLGCKIPSHGCLTSVGKTRCSTFEYGAYGSGTQADVTPWCRLGRVYGCGNC